MKKRERHRAKTAHSVTGFHWRNYSQLKASLYKMLI